MGREVAWIFDGRSNFISVYSPCSTPSAGVQHSRVSRFSGVRPWLDWTHGDLLFHRQVWLQMHASGCKAEPGPSVAVTDYRDLRALMTWAATTVSSDSRLTLSS